MKKLILGSMLAAACLTPLAASAHTDIAIGLGVPGPVYAPAPAYYAPTPVYYGPQVVYGGYYGPHYYHPYGHGYYGGYGRHYYR